MQPNHQIVEKNLIRQWNDEIVVEYDVTPTPAIPEMSGVGRRHVLGHGANGGVSNLQGEVDTGSVAAAAVNRSSTPKEHAAGADSQRAPVVIGLDQGLRAMPAQNEVY
jgi:hypothetical protein